MDWSLVLASQGIETIIDRPAEGQGWILLIPPPDYERAQAAIRQFRAENRRGRWREKLEWSGRSFHAAAILWCWVVIGVYWLDASHGEWLRGAGAMDNRAFQQGEWWRLFTAISLHSNLSHLTANLTTGVLLIGLAMARYGPGVSLLASYLAGALGNLAGFVFYQGPYRGLGASGMVMGALGLLSVQSLVHWRASRKLSSAVVSGVLAGFLLFVLIGLDPQSDVVAHLGGFAGGIGWGALLTRWRPQLLQKYLLNLSCALVLVLLFAWTWRLAWRAASA